MIYLLVFQSSLLLPKSKSFDESFETFVFSVISETSFFDGYHKVGISESSGLLFPYPLKNALMSVIKNMHSI